MNKLKIILNLLFLLSATVIAAQHESIIIDSMGLSQLIEIKNKHLSYVEDSSMLWSYNEIAESSFSSFKDLNTRFRYRNGNLWLKFELINLSKSTNFVVEFVNPYLSNVQLYELNSRNMLIDSTVELGTKVPMKSWWENENWHRTFQYDIKIDTLSTVICLIKVNQQYLNNFHMAVTEKEFRRVNVNLFEIMFFTAFYMFCLVYLVILCISISVTKQYVQWYFFGYVFAKMMMILFDSGHAALIPGFLGSKLYYLFINWLALLFESLQLGFGLTFFAKYFNIKKSAPVIYFMIKATSIFLALALMMQMLHYVNFSEPNPPPTKQDLWYANVLYRLYYGYISLLSMSLLLWAIFQFFKSHWRYSLVIFVFMSISFLGLTTQNLFLLGMTDTDLLVPILGTKAPYSSLILDSTTLIIAFLCEMIIVFNFTFRKYIRVFKKHHLLQSKIIQTKESSVNDLIEGIENERKRIARDLHDGACVQLAAIKMKMEVFKDNLKTDTDIEKLLTTINGEIHQVYKDVRNISHELNATTFENEILSTLLEQLVLRMSSAQPELNLKFYANAKYEELLPRLIKIHLYLIAQELLANVLLHAHANNATLQFFCDQNKISLSVEDDGNGFDMQSPKDGIGLSNIKTRTKTINGKLHIESTYDNGTYIVCDLDISSFTNTHLS